MAEIAVDLPAWAECFEKPARFRVLYGGRGSSKSWTIARQLLIRGMQRRHFILCAREIQLSIRDSSKRVIESQIEALGLEAEFKITDSYIEHCPTGTTFVFWGLSDSAEKLRSAEGITLAWIEEAQTVSQASLDALFPTVRAAGSEIWISFNPQLETDPVYKMFIANAPPPKSIVCKVNYSENPWFPEALRDQMEWDRETDPDKFRHVWEGFPVVHSAAQVFAGKWKIQPCPEPSPETPLYYGADFGFANDPTVFLRAWIDGRKLYVDRAAYGFHVEIENLPALFDTVTDARKWDAIADSSRPETISYLRNHGFPRIRATEKGKGSVAEGIEYLKNYEIIISPALKNLIDEFALYSYKTDKRTGNIMPILEDKNNHGIDALRYAMEPAAKKFRGAGLFMPVKLPGRARGDSMPAGL